SISRSAPSLPSIGSTTCFALSPASRTLRQAEYLVDVDLLFLALHPDDAERAHVDHPVHPLIRALADQDLSRLRIGLQARRQIHAVADDRVLHAVLGPHRPGDSLPGADADPHRDR